MPIQTIDGVSGAPAAPLPFTAAAPGRLPEEGRQPPAAPAAAMPAAKDVAAAVAQANGALAAMSASVQFFVDPDSKSTVVRIVDVANNEVLRQIPAQEMLDLARAIDRMRGLLLHAAV